MEQQLAFLLIIINNTIPTITRCIEDNIYYVDTYIIFYAVPTYYEYYYYYLLGTITILLSIPIYTGIRR